MVFDNDLQKVWACFTDQKAPLKLKTGVKISLEVIFNFLYLVFLLKILNKKYEQKIFNFNLSDAHNPVVEC